MRYLKGAHVHKKVAEVAKGMAAAVYEKLMRRNDWYELWKRKNWDVVGSSELEERYVMDRWPLFVEEARTTMAKLLAETQDEDLKSEIYDALIKDGTMRRGRLAAQRLYRDRALEAQEKALIEARKKGLVQ